MKKFVYISFFVLLPLDMFTGVMMRAGIVSGGSLLNPSVLYKLLLFSLLVVKYFKYEKNILGLLFFLYFAMVVPFLGILFYPTYIKQELIDSTYILNSFLLLNYLTANKSYFFDKINKIVIYNFWITFTTLLISNYFEISSSTYTVNGVEIGSKGLLQGGNIMSVLGVVFYTYFLFGKKSKVLLLLSLVLVVLLQTKAIFIVVIVTFVFLLNNVFYSKKIFVAISILIILLIPFISEIFIYLKTIYVNSGFYIILKHQNMDILDSNLIENLYFENRRVLDTIEQFFYQFTDVFRVLFGVGSSGQIVFWNRDSLTFSGMDISDFIFRYGLIGGALFFFVFILPMKNYYKEYGLTVNFAVLFFIYFYSALGGYVITSHALMTFIAIFTFVIYSQNEINNL